MVETKCPTFNQKAPVALGIEVGLHENSPFYVNMSINIALIPVLFIQSFFSDNDLQRLSVI